MCRQILSFISSHFLCFSLAQLATSLHLATFLSPALKFPPLHYMISAYFHNFCLFLVWGRIHRERCQTLQLQQWKGEVIFSWREQIGRRQSSTAITAVEEAKCACGRRSTQMTAPEGQQFPSDRASGRWSLVCWVWLIWHISDGRWTAHLNMAVPGD